MRMRLSLILLLSIMSVPALPFQGGEGENAPGAKQTVVPGAGYNASWLHTLLLGSNWRDLWTTPVGAEVLDLRHFAGGLKPVKRGGGSQTKSLRLLGGDGKEYKFRSMDKEARRALPKELQESVAGDYLQDQISSANPAAALIVQPLLTAVGVLSVEPSLVILPRDSALGEFEAEFGGTLGTIEENPTADPDGEAGFAGAENIKETFDLFKRLEKNNREAVDAREFLKARLMDIYVGDWDRHAGQWRWAGFRREGGGWLWKPIPRDRDWAFSKFGGLIPTIAEETVPELKGFGEGFTDIEGLTWKGRHLDRRLLVALDRPAWDSVTQFVARNLTDSVIESAVRRLPPEMYAKAGAEMERGLKLRRAALPGASDEFYALCTEFPDIRGSNKAEDVRINYLDGHRVSVELSRRRDEKEGTIGTPFYSRIFSDLETQDIRVYLLGGDDKVVVDGPGTSTTTVRVIVGEGDAEITDNSGKGVAIYDVQAGTTVHPGPHTTITRDEVKPEPGDDVERFEPHYRDYGHRWKAAPWLSITPDYGLFIGGGPILYDYGFRAHPEVYRMVLRAGIATTAVRFKMDYLAEFFTLIPGARASLHVSASQIESLNFFGFGNETPHSEELLQIAYYRVHQQQVLIEPAVDFVLLSRTTLSVGSALKYVDTDVRDGTSLQDMKPYGSGKSVGLMNVFGGLIIDTRDRVSATTRGFLVDVEGAFYPRVLDNEKSFSKVWADARTALSAGADADVTLAMRVAGEKVWGDLVPFFELPSVGGFGTVRGYDGQRFTGDASAYGSAEVRIALAKVTLMVPGTFGVLAFADAGKVYLNGVTSSLWHSSVGGGVWFSFIKRENVFHLSVAHSQEKTGIYADVGFMF
jgi:surface antigen Omp85-like protein